MNLRCQNKTTKQNKKTLERPREVGTKNPKGRGVSKSVWGEKWKESEGPDVEINQVTWNVAQLIVWVAIGGAQSRFHDSGSDLFPLSPKERGARLAQGMKDSSWPRFPPC